MSTKRPRIEGFAVVSLEGMIAGSDSSFPDVLKIPADHEFYQKECKDHARFVATCKTFWDRVVVYDVAPLS